jgi:hypothetical protein
MFRSLWHKHSFIPRGIPAAPAAIIDYKLGGPDQVISVPQLKSTTISALFKDLTGG